MRSAPAVSPSSACASIRQQQACSCVGSRLAIAAATFLPGLDGDVRRRQGGIETSHQPFMDGLALCKNPDPERRIEIVHPLQQPLVEPPRIEKQGWISAPSASCRMLSTSTSTWADVNADRKPAGSKAGEPGLIEHGPQFLDDLAQRGARLFLVRSAPEQVRPTVPGFPAWSPTAPDSQDRGRLARSQFHRSAVELYGQSSDQRNGQRRRAIGRGRRLPRCRNGGGISHCKSLAAGSIHVKLYQSDATRISRAAAGSRNRVGEPPCHNL